MEQTIMEPDHDDAVSIALIYTYSELADIFVNLARQEGCNPIVAFGTLEAAMPVAKKLEESVEVILSRGGTADFVRHAVEIPVVSIPITPFDAIRAVYEAKKSSDNIAIFNHKDKMFGLDEIEKMCDVTITEYIFGSVSELKRQVNDAKSHGIQACIGGSVTADLAIQLGMAGILIQCGEEAVRRSIREAIHLIRMRRIERGRAARLKVIFESIAEGVLATDENNRVTIYNSAAERMFGISAERVIGQDVQAAIPEALIDKVFESGRPEMAAIQEINGGVIACNRIPILNEGKRLGVVSTFQDVTKIQKLEERIREKLYSKGFIAKHRFGDILTRNSRMQELKELAAHYATTDSAVLIEGDSGTGKELFAQSIHNVSQRRNGPFVAVNCAAIPEHLLESELFGYEGGAFTGARKEGKQGLFELAHNGTIFLDEIAEIPRPLQARLLRVVQEKEFMRVGGNKIVPVNIRIISATNKNLEQKVERGEFRDDLFYRLNVFFLHLPSLRDRKEDIPLLAANHLRKYGSDIPVDALMKALDPLALYDWPGNIRQLFNIVERLSLLLRDAGGKPDWEAMIRKVMDRQSPELTLRIEMEQVLKVSVNQVEQEIIDRMLAKYHNDYEKVAKILDVGRTTIWRKMSRS